MEEAKFRVSLEDKVSKPIGDIDKAAKGAAESTSKFSEGINSPISTKSVLALTAASKAINLITGAASEAYRQYEKFDTALREVNTILPIGQRLTEQNEKALRGLAVTYGTEAAVQAKAYYQIISAGVTDATKASKLLDAANKLSIGGLSELGASINVVTDIINVYGDDVISAADATDTLFQTVKLGKTTIPELAGSIGRVLPVAKQMNISFSEIAGTLAFMTTKGLSTSQRVTQLNAIFTGLITNSERAYDVLGDQAEAFSIAGLKAKGFQVFLQDLITATGGSEVKLKKLLGSTEAVNGVLTIAGGGFDKLAASINDMNNRAGASDRAFKELADGAEFAAKRAEKAWATVGGAVSGFFGDIVKGAYNAGGNVAAAFLEMIGATNAEKDATANLNDELKKTDEELKKLRDQRSAISRVNLSSIVYEGKINDLVKKREELVKRINSQKKEENKITKDQKKEQENSNESILEAAAALEKYNVASAEVAKINEDISGSYSDLYLRFASVIGLGTEAKATQEKLRDLAIQRRDIEKQMADELKKESPSYETIKKLQEDKLKLTQKEVEEQQKLNEQKAKERKELVTRTAGAVAGAIAQGAEGAKNILATGADLIAPGLGQVVQLLSLSKEELRTAIREFVKAIPEVIETIIENIPVLIDELIKSLPKLIESLASKMDVVALAFSVGLIEQSPKIASTIASAIAKAIPRAIGGGVRSLGSFLGFSEGGVVPSVGPKGRDIYPAMLSRGERVLTERQNQIFEQLLGAISQMGSQTLKVEQAPISVNANLTLDKRVLANTILSISRQNMRTA